MHVDQLLPVPQLGLNTVIVQTMVLPLHGSINEQRNLQCTLNMLSS